MEQGSLLSDAGVPLQDIAQLVGHSGTTVTELVDRHQIRSVIQTGATVMIDSSDMAAQVHGHSVRHSPGRCGWFGSPEPVSDWWAILGSNQ